MRLVPSRPCDAMTMRTQFFFGSHDELCNYVGVYEQHFFLDSRGDGQRLCCGADGADQVGPTYFCKRNILGRQGYIAFKGAWSIPENDIECGQVGAQGLCQANAALRGFF